MTGAPPFPGATPAPIVGSRDRLAVLLAHAVLAWVSSSAFLVVGLVLGGHRDFAREMSFLVTVKTIN